MSSSIVAGRAHPPVRNPAERVVQWGGVHSPHLSPRTFRLSVLRGRSAARCCRCSTGSTVSPALAQSDESSARIFNRRAPRCGHGRLRTLSLPLLV
jgi:hypothetical protein